ncbi:SusC/RagA family TonB-linked outer membrane protein [Flavobacterium sp. ZS1P70]|uniref:SusC/RagA family TonB-linked outer membrane protein n=1 Tax=Flavobacterium zhoui TaxID=3230414 RepID=A0ABW6I9D6_9FLAO
MKKNSFYKGSSAFWYLILFGFLLTYTPVPAKTILRQIQYLPQQSQVSGTITDGISPLAGVTIFIKGTPKTAVSDYNGKYALTASPNDILAFTYIGFATVTVPVAGRLVINIRMQEDATALREVKINAGYYSVKESERTGSIAKITSKDIEKQPVTNVLAAMQGRMAGVNITQTTGTPGGGFDIQIRGQNSLRAEGNAPLYIIDGVPYSSDPIGSNFTATIFPTTTSPLNSISPDAIDSIEILKDADATAIYGSRGANGVVLITTKKGKKGKTQCTVNASTGVGQVTRFMKLMDTKQYLSMRAQAFKNDGFTQYPDWAYDINGNWDQNRYTDWQKVLTGGTAQITELQGTFSGGSESTQFLLGGNHHIETTVFPGDFKYKKGGVNLNINHTSENKKFRLTLSTNYTVQDNDQPSFDFTVDSRRLSPNAPALYDKEGTLNWENGTWVNPLSNLYGVYKSRINDLVANTVLSYKILPSLEIKSSFGYSDTHSRETRIAPSTVYNPAYGLGPEYSALFVSNIARRSWIAEPQIAYKTEFGQGELNALLGSTFQQQLADRLTEYGVGFTSNSLIYDLASASSRSVVLSDQIVYKYQAFFGRLNYNWKKRYFLNLTGRRDGSSRFGPSHQFANFGAVGAAWLFSKENFIMDNPVISFGKLRASYGTTGNDQIGDYQFLNTYTSSAGIYQGTVGLHPSRLYNPDFGWETNRKLEVALEVGFLQDRIFLTAAMYRNSSSNQLVGIPMPGTTGFTFMQANLDATVQNKGYEFTLLTHNFRNDTFKWITNFNLTVSRNKLLEFPGLDGSVYKEQYRIGEPLNIKLAYHYTGIDAQTGLYQFEDVNRDGQITFPDDKQTVVDLNPKFFGGLQNQLNYKRWSLDFLFQFVKQQNLAFTMGNAGTMSNQPASLTDSWQQPGDNAHYQIYTAGANAGALNTQSQYESSDAAIVDASFIRLKNISLTYDLPLHEKITQCRISLQSQNLLVITPYDDGDPEFSGLGYLPPLRVITAGIQLTF